MLVTCSRDLEVEIAPNASRLLQQALSQLVADRSSLSLSVQGMISAHVVKPWIDGFWSSAIRPAQPTTDPKFFGPLIAHDARGPWFFPSKTWWLAHAHTSHPPDGAGCDVEAHTDFLSADGSVHEFDYATIFTNGCAKVLDRMDFVVECDWWRKTFQSR